MLDGLQAATVAAVPAGSTLLALEDRTAVVGVDGAWRVLGRGRAHVRSPGGDASFVAGQTFALG